VGPISLYDRAFDGNVVHLPIIVSTLPFVFEFGARSTCDGMDCSVSREVVALLWRLWLVQAELAAGWVRLLAGGFGHLCLGKLSMEVVMGM